MTVTAADGILTLVLDRGECRINPTSIGLLSDALSAVEKAPHPKALVITGTGKFFCNGLDVEWMQKHGAETGAMLESFWRVLARLLVMDCHTVCAMNGHAFGAGLFVALACDWRIMRTKQGFLNFPELNLGMRLSKGFAELAKAKLSPSTLRQGVLAGKRFSSAEGLAAGVIDAECAGEVLLEEAQRMARANLPSSLKLARFNPKMFTQMKTEMYTDAYRALTLPGTAAAPPDARL
mmetsp:Transcript_22862/g.47425  ORF Transcript_22862/g.47425 Transcript_22862/m.47425 type:complete len:236 (+) Transcript_22862:1-708(+)